MYGEDIKTQQFNLCKNKAERKDKFKRGACDRFVLEMEDVGDKIKKIRIGHDEHGLFAGWHVDRVEIRRLKKSGKVKFFFVNLIIKLNKNKLKRVQKYLYFLVNVGWLVTKMIELLNEI